MKSEYDLSIIVPVYNTSLYLKDCIESLILPNYDDNWYEIIFIDDGSTDESKNIILEYQQKYTFIKYYYQKNSGQGKARNVGISQSSGKYLYFMDSDDILSGQKFVKAFNFLRKNKYEAIFFDGLSFSEYNLSDNEKYKYHREKSYGYFSNGESLYVKLKSSNDYIVSPCLYILEKKVIVDNNIKFPEGYKFEDEVFMVAFLFSLGKCYHKNEIIFFRRFRNDSTMTSVTSYKKFIGYSSVFQDLETIYSSNKCSSKLAKKTLKNQLRTVYVNCLIDYHNSDKDKNLQLIYEKLLKIAQKHNYFDWRGFLATKNYKIYSRLSSISRKIKKQQNN